MKADLHTQRLAETVLPAVEIIAECNGLTMTEEFCQQIKNSLDKALEEGLPIKTVVSEIEPLVAEIESRQRGTANEQDCRQIREALEMATNGTLLQKAPLPDAFAPARQAIDLVSRLVIHP